MNKEKKFLIASALLPGAGQFLAGHIVKGVLFVIMHLLMGGILLAGLFSNVLYKFVSLGDKPEVRTIFKTTAGDNSLDYLVNGALFFIILILFTIFYVYNLKDAKKLGKFIDAGNSLPKGEKYRDYVMDEFFMPTC